MKKRMILFFAVMALALSMLSTVAFASEPLNGRITARIGDRETQTGTPADRTRLLARIADAEAYYAETRLSADGEDVAEGEWWATAAILEVFRTAIDLARAAVAPINHAPGVPFDITIGIEGNTGFAGMIMQFGFPSQLQVLSFTDNREDYDPDATNPPNEELDFEAGFTAPLTNPAVPTSIRVARRAGGYDFLHAGWAGKTENFAGSGDLFTFRVQVLPGTAVGALEPITVAIANAIEPYDERPTDKDMNPLRILLPCGAIGGGIDEAGTLGHVAIISVVAP